MAPARTTSPNPAQVTLPPVDDWTLIVLVSTVAAILSLFVAHRVVKGSTAKVYFLVCGVILLLPLLYLGVRTNPLVVLALSAFISFFVALRVVKEREAKICFLVVGVVLLLPLAYFVILVNSF